MAAGDVVWPDYARPRAGGYELAALPDTARTEFDDGAVQQRRIATELMLARTVVVDLTTPQLAQWRTWAAEHGYGYAHMQDPHDAQWRAVRIVGGASGVTYRQVRRGPGRPLWEARMTLEGPETPIPSPSFGPPPAAPPLLLFSQPRPGDAESVEVMTLPAATGGAGPLTYRLTPALPAAAYLTLDAAARTLTAGYPQPSVYPYLDETVFEWHATDAAGRTGSTTVHIARAFRAHGTLTYYRTPTAPTAALWTRATWYWLPTWFVGGTSSLDVVMRALSLETRTANPADRTVSIDFGRRPPDGPNRDVDLTADAARRLRLRLKLGDHLLDISGPNASATPAMRRDSDDPYRWDGVTVAALQAWLTAAVANGTVADVYAWLGPAPAEAE